MRTAPVYLRASPLDRLMPSPGRFRSVLTDPAFWTGLVILGLGAIVLALLVNFAVMPIWTRHSSTIEVPSVREMTPLDAERTLRLSGLDAERREQPFNPNLPADVVVDQTPSAGLSVKPGRRVYYYVNASPTDRVSMPAVLAMAQGQATAEIENAGLTVGAVRYDTLRSPNENTVTRQIPEAGRLVPVGTPVSIWLSPGPDPSRQVLVPDLVGMSADAARDRIRDAGLWISPSQQQTGRVTRQTPERGTRVPAGSEVALTTDGPATPGAAPADSSAR